MSARASTWMLLAPGAAFLAALFAYPLFMALAGSLGLDGSGFTLDHYLALWRRAALRRGLWMSIYYGLAPLPPALLISLGLALALRRGFYGQRLFEGLYKIPMAIPSIVVALIVLTLLEQGGALDRVAARWGEALPRLVRDPWGIGVILGTVWKRLPFLTMVSAASLAAVPADLGHAARSLGASPWRVLWRIELPLAAPGITAATLLTFIASVGSFAIPDLLGPPDRRPLSTIMVSEYFAGNVADVYAIGMTLAGVALLVMLAVTALAARATPAERPR